MGIGRETALLFAAEGAKVALMARSERLLEEVAELIQQQGGEALVCKTDVTDSLQVVNAVSKIITKWGRIDILINNAGYGMLAPLMETPVDEMRRLFDVNVFGAFNVTHAVYPQMQKQGGGQIINISSIVALRSIPSVTAYCMSKYALNAMSDGLRVEVARDNIKVISIYPGSTDTDFHNNQKIIGNQQRHPKWFAKSAAEVAKVVLRASLKNRRDSILTWSARGMALVQFLMPSLLDKILDIGYRKYHPPK